MHINLNNRTASPGFFDEYTRFYETSQTTPVPNRLNSRYTYLIERNRQYIEGARVLDLASHDARWSFAALRNGAKHVTGVEPRADLVTNGIETLRQYGVSDDSMSFVVGDALEEMRKMSVGQFDTVFCFGFFYHTMHHFALVQEIARLRPKALILDTTVYPNEAPIVVVREVDAEIEGNAVGTSSFAQTKALEGVPTKSAVTQMLEHVGFSVNYLNWHDGTIVNWEDIADYRQGIRVTALALSKF